MSFRFLAPLSEKILEEDIEMSLIWIFEDYQRKVLISPYVKRIVKT